MSRVLGQLCAQVAGDAFGPVVQAVVRYLFSSGARPLHAIIVHCAPYSRAELRLGLQVMLQHGLVTFALGRTNQPEYALQADRVLLLIRYARYLLLVKTCYDSQQEVLLDELLRQGQDTFFNIVVRATRRINESMEEGGHRVSAAQIRDKFLEMVRAHYFQRCSTLAPPPDPNAPRREDEPPPPPRVDGVPTLQEPEGEKAWAPPPNLDMGAVQRALDGKQHKPPQDTLMWCVNFSRLDEQFRDQLLLSSVTRTCGEPAAEVMRHFLALAAESTRPWERQTNPVSMAQLRERIVRRPATSEAASKYCDEYIRIMSEGDTAYLTRFGDAGGGQYILNACEVYQRLGWAVIENIVQERFGSRAGRIFRLIRERRYVEQDKIHEWAMIPAKEAKLLTYQLHRATYVSMADLRRPGQQVTPGRSVLLFHTDFNHLVRMQIEVCYRALLNMLVSRTDEVRLNQRLHDKQLRVESIIAQMREQGADEEQLAEVAEALTDTERAQLKRAAAVTDRLTHAEIQLDQTLFLLQTALRYLRMK